MPQGLPFCPHCGARQLKAGARFCHACGRPIPPAPTRRAEPPPSARQFNLWWLYPVLLAGVVAVALLAREPTRERVADFLAAVRERGTAARATPRPSVVTPAAAASAGTPAGVGSVETATTPRAPLPTATPPSTATPLPTPTPPPTATPLPTPTPQPTDTPSPTPAPVRVRTRDTVNVRDGPGTVYPSLARVPAGTTFVVQGQNETGTWWQVCCLGDRPGWILAELLSAEGPVHVPVIADIAPPPDPGRVVFASDRNGFAHLFLMDGNGANLRPITFGNEYFWAPIFSPDGTRLAYVSKVAGNTEVFVAYSNGSNARPISNHPAEDEHPAWFPNNAEIAFASRRDGNWEIYRMHADGSNVRRLTFDGRDNRFLDVSPDGSRIAYVSLGGGYPTVELRLIDADGSALRVLYSYPSRKQRDEPGRFIYRPDWSPDGVHIAFGADDDDDGLIGIVVINTITGQWRHLIRDGNGPAWSPDGRRLIYKPAGQEQILFVADDEGHRLYRLTPPGYHAWSPDWAP